MMLSDQGKTIQMIIIRNIWKKHVDFVLNIVAAAGLVLSSTGASVLTALAKYE